MTCSEDILLEYEYAGLDFCVSSILGIIVNWVDKARLKGRMFLWINFFPRDFYL